jgi:ABC-type methionine transport system permease subunit
VSLVLTLTASGIFAALKGVGLDLSNPNTVLSNSYAQVFSNAVFSVFYLSLPFICMIVIDLRAMKKRKK